MHKRQEIRNHIRNLLTGKTAAGSRIYFNQAMPAWVEEMPIILVYTDSEDANKFNQSPKMLRKDLQIRIEIVADGTEDMFRGDGKPTQDLLDEIALIVEDEMSRDETLGETVEDSIYNGTEFNFVHEGQNAIGSARLSYLVSWVDPSPRDRSLQSGIGNFEKLNGGWDLAEQDDINEAEDNIDIPQ